MLLKLLFLILISHVVFFFFCLDQERLESSSKLVTPTPISNGDLRHLIKPRTMAQAPIPPEESSIDLSSDGDTTIVEKGKILTIYNVTFNSIEL